VFTAIRSEVSARQLAIRQWFAFAGSAPAPVGVVSKGLVFLQNYAVYEFTVISALTAALTRAKTHGLLLHDVRPELLTLILNSEFDSSSQSGASTKWDRRIELFQRARCADPLGAVTFEGVFPHDGSHFRPPQLRTIWRILGISAPVVQVPRHLGRIEEMVAHRNAIAHGREAPEAIGRRFSDSDITDRITDAEDLCMHIVDTLDLHSNTAANLRA
jgi:hypothetical protein